MEMETSGAHSFRTILQSRFWKAKMTNCRILVRTVHERELSRLIDRVRRNRSENSVGLSANKSGENVRGGVEAVMDGLEIATPTPGIQPLSPLRIDNENDQKDVVVGRVFIVAGPEVAAFDVSAKMPPHG